MADVVGDVADVGAEADHRGLVADRVHAGGRPLGHRGLPQVALDPLGGGVEVVRASPVRDGQQRVDRPHGVPLLDEGVDDVRPDEPGGAGDEDDGHVSLSQEARASVARVRQVILPVLNEREALPWVLERMPAGYEPLVVDNGSTDGSGALAAALGAQVVHEPQPGFGAACFAGLCAARAERRLLHGLRCVVRPARAAAGGRPGRRRRRGARARRAQPAARGVAAARARGEPGADRGAAPPHRRGAARPRADARGAPRGAARPRPARPAVRLAARDGGARGGGRVAHRGGRRDVPPPRGPLEGHRDRAGHAAHGGDMAAALA